MSNTFYKSYLDPSFINSIDMKILSELSNARTRAILDGKDNFEFMGREYDVNYAKQLIDHIQDSLMSNQK
tara:strand:- start:1610 stop:1819 length:210 start_codon:yes stop_codon:yes gene_type:complete